MTTGALIFAHNNGIIDYESMARWSAANIERHLDIPVKIITDLDPAQENTRWFGDFEQHMTWHNHSRVSAFDLSPWDRTLVIDADYVVASDQLRSVLLGPQSFLCFRKSFDVAGQNDFSGLDTFGNVKMPMWWATVMCFDKCKQNQMIFDVMTMIRDHWNHYRKIYKIQQTTYRNDHALSIALCLVNGHVTDIPSIPWSMASVMPEYQLQQVDQDHYRVDFIDRDQRSRWTALKNHDFHAMGKRQLGDIVASAT